MDNINVTETRLGRTLYVVKAECSKEATETVEQKLERIISRHVSDTKTYHYKEPETLAMCENQSEYRKDTIL